MDYFNRSKKPFDWARPHPDKSYLPKRFTQIYLIVFGVAAVALYLTKQTVLCAGLVGVALCVYILADMFANLKYAPPTKMWKSILGIAVCLIAAIGSVAIIIVLFKGGYLTAALSGAE